MKIVKQAAINDQGPTVVADADPALFAPGENEGVVKFRVLGNTIHRTTHEYFVHFEAKEVALMLRALSAPRSPEKTAELAKALAGSVRDLVRLTSIASGTFPIDY